MAAFTGRIVTLACATSTLALAVACGGAGGPGEPPQEKTATTQSDLVVSNPTPIKAFPDGYNPPSCQPGSPFAIRTVPVPREVEFYGAYPTATCTQADPTCNGDPYTTQYSHAYNYLACQTNDLRYQHLTDLFAIPKANGFKYLVKRLTPDGGGKFLNPGGQDFEMLGVQRVDYNWWMEPWNHEGVTEEPWVQLDGNSHPADGTDSKSQDWLSLWNVTYTYGDNGPNGSYPKNSVESSVHTCVTILPMTVDAGGNPQPILASTTPIDFFVAADLYDPLSHPW
jgi:hypothetical protein